MSVMLPRLHKAIISICPTLFLESLSMFSHETPDPSNQSSLSWALETCLYHNFLTSIAAAEAAYDKWKFKMRWEKCKLKKNGECVPKTFTFTTHQPFIIFFSHPSLNYALYSLKDLYLLAPLLHSRDCSTYTNTHAQQCVCVSPTDWTLRFRPHCP